MNELLMEPPAKVRKLNDVRRSLPHCTASALAAIVNAVRAGALPEGRLHRNDFRAARDYENKQLDTKFGPILQSVQVKDVKGDIIRIPIAHPFANLVVAIDHAQEFSSFLCALCFERPSSPINPWHILLYTDEVTPGNPLATFHTRKFHSIYWSFLEFGDHVLCHEEAWFTLCTELSTKMKKVSAGLSQLIGAIIKVFMDPHGHNISITGILLEFPSGQCIRLWAVIGGFLMDGAAHKSVWHSRGDGASCPCLKCLNFFTESSKLVDEDGNNMLVCKVVKSCDLAVATSTAVRNKVRYLETMEGRLGKGAFQRQQQALGMTHQPDSLLLDRSLDSVVDPCRMLWHDWMHGFFVAGVWNISLYLFFEKCIELGHKNVYQAFSNYISHWTWPSRIHGNHLHDIFSKEKQDTHRKARRIKAQASDMLSIIGVTAMFIIKVVRHACGPACSQYCEAMLALITVIETLMQAPKIKPDPTWLLSLCERFLDLFKEAWGYDFMIPKFHWMLHYHTQPLLNCFCLERKHRVAKRYAGDILNISKKPSQSLLMETTSHHLCQLGRAGAFKFNVGLVGGKPANKKLCRVVAAALDTESSDIKYSVESRFGKFGTCKGNDMVVFSDAATAKGVAKVLGHFEVEGIPISLVTMYKLIQHDVPGRSTIMQPCCDGVQWIETQNIHDTLVHCTLTSGNAVVLMDW